MPTFYRRQLRAEADEGADPRWVSGFKAGFVSALLLIVLVVVLLVTVFNRITGMA